MPNASSHLMFCHQIIFPAILLGVERYNYYEVKCNKMIKYFFIFIIIVCCKVSYSQTFSATSLNADIHNLYNAYLLDFKNIWGKRKQATDKEIVYHSNYRVTGSISNTNFVIYNKADRTFAFTAVMDSASVKALTLNEAFNKVYLPVGKFKALETTFPSVRTYILSDKKSAPFKAKKLTVMIASSADNLAFENGIQFTFKIIPVAENEDK